MTNWGLRIAYAVLALASWVAALLVFGIVTADAVDARDPGSVTTGSWYSEKEAK